MSPEQARGDPDLDPRSDIYSLGSTLYEALTGVTPYRGAPHLVLRQVIDEDPRPLRQLNDRIPRDLETICLKAMARERARRYPTAGELADDLRRWLRGEPIHARPVGPVERMYRWAALQPARRRARRGARRRLHVGIPRCPLAMATRRAQSQGISGQLQARPPRRRSILHAFLPGRRSRCPRTREGPPRRARRDDSILQRLPRPARE